MRLNRVRGVVTALVVAASAARAGAQPAGDPTQLVGFTAAVFKGGGGVRTFTQACQAEFDATARMCKSTEVLETIVWPATLSGLAWVMPVFVPGVNGTDASGVVGGSPVSLSCNAWTDDGGVGLSVDATGSMRARDCGNTLSVACCKPVRMPKPTKR
jgi:hypothetical protein